MELVILGTASMVPTRQRNVQAFYLEFEGEGMLFDCGEGTQRQMNVAGLSRAKVSRVFLTHWHGDHVAGLIGLVQTIGNSGYSGTLHIHGPRETQRRFAALMAATIFENKIPIEVHEHDPKDEEVIVDEKKYSVSCIPASHGVPCLAYAFQEKERTRVNMDACAKLGIPEGRLVGKLSRGESVEIDGKTVEPSDVTYRVPGKRIAIIPDTQPHDNLVAIARHADVLICESTFGNEHKEQAQGFRHMTAEKAAEVAKDAEVARLLLTHFSQRYPRVDHLVEEARAIFPNVEAAEDLMRITL